MNRYVIRRAKITGVMILTQASLLLLTSLLLAEPEHSRPGSQGKSSCTTCHWEQASSDITAHTAQCVTCHGGNPSATSREEAHIRLTSNPADLSRIAESCGQCHEAEIHRFAQSLHATAAGELTISRSFAGKSDSAYDQPVSLYGGAPFIGLPSGKPFPGKLTDLIDDILRRRCLQCHVSTLPDRNDRGCMACHRSSDPQRRPHDFTRSVPNSRCFLCHRENWAGGEYEGRYWSDRGEMYGEHDKTVALRPDIHSERGLACVDCHRGREVMGDGSSPLHAGQVSMLTCKTCHFATSDSSAQSVIPVTVRNGKIILTGSDRRDHVVPSWNPDTAGHNVAAHSQVRCEACHALWTFGDFGMNLIRTDIADYYRWSYLLPQNDSLIDSLFQRNLSRPFTLWEPPLSPDLLTGKIESGVWLQTPDFRRFEVITLGTDQDGNIGLLRPFLQFAVSYINNRGQVIVNNETIQGGFDRYTPHTIRPSAWQCERCHGRESLVDKSRPWPFPERWKQLMTPGGMLSPGTEVIQEDLKRRLEKPSKRFLLTRSRLPPWKSNDQDNREEQ